MSDFLFGVICGASFAGLIGYIAAALAYREGRSDGYNAAKRWHETVY